MSPHGLHCYLDTYLSVRGALGFQMRAARTLLRDFVGFLGTRGTLVPFGPSGLSTGPVPRQRDEA
jgi:hypothetical protein